MFAKASRGFTVLDVNSYLSSKNDYSILINYKPISATSMVFPGVHLVLNYQSSGG